ncbi:Nucleoside transporter FUN26 [Lachnellula suecica]|uniref:Nucleoside transporter FUN26 n=1 Tax=Lachnellula suecica TaxID=602035 RepID=A0A8T9BVV1_9HELO|nr:Nucleoside transporter FUN26 [Lachnellula suecica]
MSDQTAFERLRAIFSRKSVDDQEYEPLGDADEDVRRPVRIVPGDKKEEPFSWFEYSIFFLLGIAMLWAWNMFLAAAPYFQNRFKNDAKILNSFQSAIISVGCVTNLTFMLILMNLQAKASYPKRILSALALNVVVFTLLSISTSYFRGVSESGYLAFTLIMVFSTSTATGFLQNGTFAFASSFGRPEYIQAIMTGQAVAGVLPSVAQIASVLALPTKDAWADPAVQAATIDDQSSKSAFVYFMTATGISILTLLAVLPLIRKHNRTLETRMMSSVTSIEEAEQAKRTSVGMRTLYKKLHWLAAGVFLCFAVTMFFPVFTGKVVSVLPEDKAPKLFQPASFIPLGFLLWNLGDLCGRLSTIIPIPVVTSRPRVLFLISILRAGQLPLYLLCNIEGKGATISSDAFYLFVVQFGFGLTNGWLSSSCMMSANEWVEESEREATGGFMAVNLVAGLTFGSLLSFAASGVS